jgi:hypothetical protein
VTVSKDDEELLSRLEEFLRRETGSRRVDLSSDSDLSRDLDVDGFDGVDLMTKFGEVFHVDMSAFDPGRYFGPEAAFNPLLVLLPSWWRWRKSFRPLLARDLIAAARTGRWPGGHDR